MLEFSIQASKIVFLSLLGRFFFIKILNNIVFIKYIERMVKEKKHKPIGSIKNYCIFAPLFKTMFRDRRE